MKFGVMFANVGPMGTAEGAVGIAQAAEAAGIGFDDLTARILEPAFTRHGHAAAR